MCHHTHTPTHTRTYLYNENIYFLWGGWSELLGCGKGVGGVLSLGSRLECRLVWLGIPSASLSVCLSVCGGIGLYRSDSGGSCQLVSLNRHQNHLPNHLSVVSRLPLCSTSMRTVHGISTSTSTSTSTTCDAIICLNVMLR